MIEPLVIQGPAIVKFGTYTYYVQNEVTATLRAEKWNPASAINGPLGERHLSFMWDIVFTPVGMKPSEADWLKIFPHTPAMVGKSIMTGACVIHSYAQDKTFTFQRAGINNLATVFCAPNKTLFGQMSLIGLSQTGTPDTDAAAMKVIASAAFADTTWTGETVHSDIYEAAWGITSPYDAMGSHDGFEIQQPVGVKLMKSVDKGITAAILESLGCVVRFAPSNLTQTEIDGLLRFQGTDVIRPGQSYGSADLVITGPNLVVTCKRMGPSGGSYKYQLGENESQGVEFVNRLTAPTAGFATRLVEFADPE